jgi:hypothetical protein
LSQKNIEGGGGAKSGCQIFCYKFKILNKAMLINTYINLIILHKEFQLSKNRGNFKTLLCKMKGGIMKGGPPRGNTAVIQNKGHQNIHSLFNPVIIHSSFNPVIIPLSRTRVLPRIAGVPTFFQANNAILHYFMVKIQNFLG